MADNTKAYPMVNIALWASMRIIEDHLPSSVLGYKTMQAADGMQLIWNGSGPYIPPTEQRIHDIASTSVEDAGTVKSSGTANIPSQNLFIDESADFIADGIVGTDLILDDGLMLITRVLQVVDSTTLAVVGWFDAIEQEFEQRVLTDMTYRIVARTGLGPSCAIVTGLSQAFQTQQEFIILDGTNNVPTQNAYLRQSLMRVFGSGANGVVGVLTSTAQTDGTVTLQVVNSNNQSANCLLTIPQGVTGFLLDYHASIAKSAPPATGTANVNVSFGNISSISYTVANHLLERPGSSSISKDRSHSPIRLPSFTEVFMEIDVSENDTLVSAGMEVLLVKNEVLQALKG